VSLLLLWLMCSLDVAPAQRSFLRLLLKLPLLRLRLLLLAVWPRHHQSLLPLLHSSLPGLLLLLCERCCAPVCRGGGGGSSAAATALRPSQGATSVAAAGAIGPLRRR